MALSLKNLCKWKLEDGYAYVAFNEYTDGIDFIKEEDLAGWYSENYRMYCAEMIRWKKPILKYEEFCKQNRPDNLKDFISNKLSMQTKNRPVYEFECSIHVSCNPLL